MKGEMYMGNSKNKKYFIIIGKFSDVMNLLNEYKQKYIYLKDFLDEK